MGDAKDKICDICGSIGYPEHIVTCCKCKKASEHIYCTLNLLYSVPEKWYCKECFGRDEVVHDENMQLKDKIVSYRSNFEKTNTPAEKSVLLDESATSEQLCIDGGCPKSFGCQEISHQVLDIGEADKAAFAGSSSSKHVMASFPHSVPSDKKASPDQINVDQKQLAGNSEPLVSRDISLQVLDVGAELAGSHSSKPTMQLSSHDSSVKKTNIPVERSMQLSSHGSSVKKTNIPVERIVPLDERESSEQTHVDRKEPIGSPKPIGSQNWPFHVHDVGMGETYPVAGSPSSKHVMQPSSRDSSLKRVETGKVKFLSAEEVPFLRSGIQVSRKWGSLGSGPHRIDQENIKSHPILPRKPICMSTLANSKESKVLHQRNKGFDYTDEMLTPETEIQSNKTSVLFKEKSVGGSVGIDIDEGKTVIAARTEPILSSSSLLADIEGKKEIKKPKEREVIDKCKRSSKIQILEAHIPDKEPMVLDNQIASDVSMVGGSGTFSHSAVQFAKPGFREKNLQLKLLINPEDKHENNPAPKAFWKGDFQVFDVISHVYSGIRGHFPAQVSHKAYETSKKLPEIMKFKIVPRMSSWPHIFQSYVPTKDDIGLYFFPSDHERLKEEYVHLLERIDSHDFAMKSYVGDIELLIFTSKQLPVDSQLIATEFYLWGVFRHVKCGKCSLPTREQFSNSPAASERSKNCDRSNKSCEGNNEEGDMVADSEICKLDKMLRVNAPLDFVKPISKDPTHIKNSLVNIPLTGRVQVDLLPGSSRHLSPKLGCEISKFTHTSSAVSRKERSDIVSSSFKGGYEYSAAKRCDLKSKHHQNADHHKTSKHHSSSSCIPVLGNKKGFNTYNGHGSLIEGDQGTSSKRKWVCLDETKKETTEISRNSDAMNDQPTMKPSRNDGHHQTELNKHPLQQVKEAGGDELQGSRIPVSNQLDYKRVEKQEKEKEMENLSLSKLKKEQPPHVQRGRWDQRYYSRAKSQI